RLSGARVEGAGDTVREALAATGVTVFPGWEFYANAGAENTLFDLLPEALVFVDEPTSIKTEHERWWEKVTRRHEMSGVGRLATPEDIYVRPEEWDERLAKRPGGDLEQLGLHRAVHHSIEDDDAGLGSDSNSTPVILSERIARVEESPESFPNEAASGNPSDTFSSSFRSPDHPITRSPDLVEFSSQPTTRFHGSVPAMVEEVKKLTGAGQRVIFAAPNTGEMERLADIFTEYQAPFRLGSRNPVPGSETYLD